MWILLKSVQRETVIIQRGILRAAGIYTTSQLRRDKHRQVLLFVIMQVIVGEITSADHCQI